jgi:hypothetical protein
MRWRSRSSPRGRRSQRRFGVTHPRAGRVVLAPSAASCSVRLDRCVAPSGDYQTTSGDRLALVAKAAASYGARSPITEACVSARNGQIAGMKARDN